GAHDAGADDQNVRRLSHRGLLGKGIGADNQSSLIAGKASEISPVAAQWASTLVEESEPIVQRERRAAGRRARRLPADDVSGARPCFSCQRATSSQVVNQTPRVLRMNATRSAISCTRDARPLTNGWHVSTKQPFSRCMAANSLLHIWSTRAGSAIALVAPYTWRNSGASSMIHCTGTSVSGPVSV